MSVKIVARGLQIIVASQKWPEITIANKIVKNMMVILHFCPILFFHYLVDTHHQLVWIFEFAIQFADGVQLSGILLNLKQRSNSKSWDAVHHVTGIVVMARMNLQKQERKEL